MAFMFDARDKDPVALERGLIEAMPQLISHAVGARVRVGVADHHPDLHAAADTDYDIAGWRTVDGAVEITLPESALGTLHQLALALRDSIEPLAQPRSLQVMAGPMFSMVPSRDGDCFLSLAFRRDPGITTQQFQDWWRLQHSTIAIPVMGPGMLAYDQVHLDQTINQSLADSIGIARATYDAYDNLTWATRAGYLTSTSDAPAMAVIFQDEVGRIDNASRRHALMRRL
jgi:hypothetical protein